MALPVRVDDAAVLADEFHRIVGVVEDAHDKPVVGRAQSIFERLAGEGVIGLGIDVGGKFSGAGDVKIVTRTTDDLQSENEKSDYFPHIGRSCAAALPLATGGFTTIFRAKQFARRLEFICIAARAEAEFCWPGVVEHVIVVSYGRIVRSLRGSPSVVSFVSSSSRAGTSWELKTLSGGNGVIGIIAGLGLGWVWSSGETGETGGVNFSQFEFQCDLSRTYPKTGEALIRKVVIQPPTVDYRGKNVQPVSYEHMQPNGKTGQVYWQKGQFISPIPYKPNFNTSLMPKDVKGNPTVKDYLTGVTKKYNKVTCGYGWGCEGPMTMRFTAGATLVIGGIWPTALSLIVGAGFGPKREAKKEGFSLGSYCAGKTESSAAESTVPVVSQAERDRLDEMNRNLEEQLQSAGVIHDGRAMSEEDPDGPILASNLSPAIRKLDGGVLETAPTANAKGMTTRSK